MSAVTAVSIVPSECVLAKPSFIVAHPLRLPQHPHSPV